jgi:hypothetical protein
VFLVLWVQAGAQTTAASLRGLITDPSGSAIPGAVVSVANRTAQSDATGQYQFGGIAPGTYTVRVTANGFTPYEKQGYAVGAGRAQTLDIALTLQTQNEQVTVTAAEAAKVDTDPSNNAGALVLEKTELEALPDDPDDLAADLAALAGPAAGPNGGQIFIDGFTGGRLPPKQSIREIRINQNPFAAQYDRPGQGRIEILTKPGTDDWHGELIFQFSDAALNSRNPFVTTKPPYQRRQWEGELGGSLNKKTSFKFDFERRDISDSGIIKAVTLDSALNVTPLAMSIPTPTSNVEMNFRVDRQLSTNHTLTGRYTYARDQVDNQGAGGTSLLNTAYNVHNSEDTVQLVETGILSQQMVTETRFRFRRQNGDQAGGVLAPITTVLDSFTSGGSPVGVSFNNQNRYELQNFTSRVSGPHTMRWGGLMRGVTEADQSMQNYAGTFTFTSLDSYRTTLLGLRNNLSDAQIRAMGGGPSQFALSAGNPLAGVNQFDFGFFAQDEWRVHPGLSVSGGLRYEFQTHSSQKNGLAPRIGVAWAVGPNAGKSPKNVIRAGMGIFYERLSETYTLDAERSNGIRQQRFLIQNPSFYPVVPAAASLLSAAQPQTIRETDAQWSAPMLFQMAIGFERQVTKRVTVSSNYIHTSGTHALRSRNINAPLPVTGIRPYGGVNSIYLYEASGIYRQHQWVTNVTARAGSKLTLSGVYTLGHVMSNTDGAGTFPVNQYDLATEYGRAAYDIRHRLQFNGSVAMKWGLRVSPFMTITSGRPYNVTVGKDLNGDGLFNDRPAFASGGQGFNLTPLPGQALIPRNFGDGPGQVAANLRVGKTFLLGEKRGSRDPYQLVFAVNARNVLNHPNFGLPTGNLSSPLFGQSTTLAGGQGVTGTRRLDVQVRFGF